MLCSRSVCCIRQEIDTKTFTSPSLFLLMEDGTDHCSLSECCIDSPPPPFLANSIACYFLFDL